MKDPHERTSETTSPSQACERVRGRMEQLLDGGLSPLDEARDQGHLEACESCRGERDEWEGFMGLLRRAEAPAGPVAGELRVVQRELSEQIEERIAGERRTQRRMQRLSLVSAAAALLLVVGFFGLAESTPGLPKAKDISKLEIHLPQPSWGDFLSQLGSLGVPR